MLTEFKLLDEVKNAAAQVMHLSHSLESSNLQLKDLNAAVRDSTSSANKTSSAMMWLTGALAIFALAQVGVAWMSYSSNEQIMNIRRTCYQSVLQTSDIDLNYRSCLRDHGLSD
jgi:hypothetical protein